MAAEIFKDITGFEGLYKISNFGTVLNLRSNRNMRVHPGTSGFIQIDLVKDGRRQNFAIHRLVAEAFLDGFTKNVLVRHISGIKLNNRWDNLQIVARKSNGDGKARRDARVKSDVGLSKSDIAEIRALCDRGVMLRVIADRFGITRASICAIMGNKLAGHIQYRERSERDIDGFGDASGGNEQMQRIANMLRGAANVVEWMHRKAGS